ncbi:homologous recombination OB-fold protein [Tachysurus fulvidraco]|uniref:homologous recombination OB-fold protein n=1 Tax=Tachysurus fulvidraco TaxID=1234273 RepID=UPI001FEF721D|nr:homologous recombination OB-fold protein [Tachysurus fulvidraco]
MSHNPSFPQGLTKLSDMTTAACNKWRGLFSVGEELDDEDLLEADWTHTSDSGSSSVPACASLQASHAIYPYEAQQSSVASSANFSNRSSVPDSSAQLNSSESRPDKCLRSLANSSSVTQSVPHTHTASLRAPFGGSNAISSLQHPSISSPIQSNPQSVLCNAPMKDIPAQDDFDDWDVNLEELDECVPQEASAPYTEFESNNISPAKRMRSSADAPASSSLRGFCSSTPKSAPPQSFIRPSTFTPQNYLQPSVPPTCRFTSPVTPRPVRPTSQWQRGAVTPQAEHRSLFQAVSPAPLTPQTPRPLHMPVLTNHLVQLVSAASKTPQKPRSDSVRPKTRRFPGPAGALPQQISGRSPDDIVVAVPQTPAHGAVARLRNEVPSSQINDEEEFSVGPWAAMKAEMRLDERNPSCFLHSYSIVMVLRKAALRQLSKNKVPNMAVVLKSILHTHADAKAVFRDPTGEMQGTVHRRLLEDRQGELKTGAVLLLKQVGVFSPSNRNHYLNVTPNNLFRIYPPDGAVRSSSQRSQPELGPAGLPHCESSKLERGPVSQMELHFDDDDDDEAEQNSVAVKLTPPANGAVQSTTQPHSSEDAQWDADDLDELLGDLPVDSYCA